MTIEQLHAAVLALPIKERAKLAHDLLDSLDGPADPNAAAAWTEEIERRAKELADGSVQPVDWGTLREQIVQRIRERRR